MRLAHHINGQEMQSEEWTPVRNPADVQELVGYVGEGDQRQVTAAIQAARDAFPEWRRCPVAERADRLLQAAPLIEAAREELAELQTREHGKVLEESRRNLDTALHMLHYFADLSREGFAWEWQESTERGITRYIRQPVGVTAVIVPWNSPLTLGFLMLIPALLSGNPVVVKPSSLAPLTLSRVLRMVAKGLPPGVLNVVTGAGRRVGLSLAQHSAVRRIAFTGSTETGRELMRVAADRIADVSLELGGNDPAIILEDMPVTPALCRAISAGVFNASGQICLNIKRVYVHERRYQEFVEAFRAETATIRVGNGLHPDTGMGPVNNRDQMRRVEALVEEAAHQGATVYRSGTMSEWATHHEGYFLPPIIVTDIRPDAPLVAEEQFGPAIPVLPFRQWAEVQAWANGTEFGLCSSIWTPDVDRGLALARELEAGTTFINAHRAGASGVDQAFGGVKQSGLGRGHGRWAFEEATELHTLISQDPPGAS